MSRCPSCRKPVADRGANPFFPFCSDRCRLLDLGKWFDGRYRVPGEPVSDDEAGPGTAGGDPPED